MPAELPLPPLELQELVGAQPARFYDNPTGAPIFPDLPPELWDTYLDFGCGCGRSARSSSSSARGRGATSASTCTAG